MGSKQSRGPQGEQPTPEELRKAVRSRMPIRLALEDVSCDADKIELVACGVCYRQRRLEPAGRGFHEAHEKPNLSAKERRRAGVKDDKAESDEDQDESDKWKKKAKERGSREKKAGSSGALRLSPQLEGVDLYKLFELNEAATPEQIKKQYRKLALIHHPDKQGEKDEKEDKKKKDKKGLSKKDLIFVQLQETYEILSDTTKRRQYDSTLDFDEAVPEKVDPKTGFYATFGPVFNRNARFSTRRPVPELGEEETDLAKVHKFYDWWFSFETWRDFSMHDEYNLDDAEIREEKRWMDRQNARIRKKYENDEHKRILKLVETSERLDPRLQAERDVKEAEKREAKEKRARMKQEEEDAKRRKEEERRLQEEREKAEQEEKERQEREKRKDLKQAAKSLRQRLKKLVQGKCKLDGVATNDVQEMCLDLEAEALEELCESLEGKREPAAVEKAVRDAVEQWKRRRAEDLEEEARRKEETRRREEQAAREAKEAAAAAASGAAWSTEEMGILAKGLQKFPGGHGNRWGCITGLLGQCGHHRLESEVIAKVKEMSEGQSLRSMGANLDSSKFLAPKAKAPPPGQKIVQTPVQAKAEPAPKAEPKAKAKVEPAPKAKAKAEPAPKADVAPVEADWSQEQQKTLEQALQTHPASLDKNERWRLIAADVPGKTKQECVARFKFLAAAAAPKAAAAPTAEAAPKAEAASKAEATPAEGKSDAEWTQEQQKQLEDALRTHPASLDKNERWRLIAADVEGKTKQDCVARFKFLREQLKS